VAPNTKNTNDSGAGPRGKPPKHADKEDWLRPDTLRSAAEEDRLVATQSRLLKRRFDEMLEEAEEEGIATAKKKQKVNEELFSVEEALDMERPGSEKEWVRERLEYDLAERERLLRQWGELNEDLNL
jgi:hypothetical protein